MRKSLFSFFLVSLLTSGLNAHVDFVRCDPRKLELTYRGRGSHWLKCGEVQVPYLGSLQNLYLAMASAMTRNVDLAVKPFGYAVQVGYPSGDATDWIIDPGKIKREMTSSGWVFHTFEEPYVSVTLSHRDSAHKEPNVFDVAINEFKQRGISNGVFVVRPVSDGQPQIQVVDLDNPGKSGALIVPSLVVRSVSAALGL